MTGACVNAEVPYRKTPEGGMVEIAAVDGREIAICAGAKKITGSSESQDAQGASTPVPTSPSKQSGAKKATWSWQLKTEMKGQKS